MPDESDLDQKYFIDPYIYNCPFCNRRHVSYKILNHFGFNWTTEKICFAWFVSCNSCKNRSMHLTFDDIQHQKHEGQSFKEDYDIDNSIFYSVPTSFFALDSRIPSVIRDLIMESEGCLKMNYLTGASACCRKAIYELTIREDAEGPDYEKRIKFLKTKFPTVDPELFDILCHIKDMTSDKIHEQSWDEWDSGNLKLLLETLKAILHEIYVIPANKKSRSSSIRKLRETVKKHREKHGEDVED